MTRQIIAAEISLENAPLHIRDAFRYNEVKVRACLGELATLVSEVFVLSTCSRFVIYAVHEDVSPLVRFFSKNAQAAPHVNYYTNTEESIHHFFATAAGLCSPVKGDHRILTQIDQAYKLGLESESIGLVLDNLVREAMRVGKRIRTESGIDKFCSSVLDTGFSLLEECIKNLYKKTFLVVGTDSIARRSMEWLHRHRAQHVFLIGNDMERNVSLAERYHAKAISVKELSKYFSVADIVIGGTNHDGQSNELCGGHSFDIDFNKKRIVLDFGIPRNFSSKLRDQPNIELYNLDDLKGMHTSPLDDFGGLGEAWEIVMEETQHFVDVLRQLEISPILASYWTKLSDIKSRELEWLFPRLSDVSEQDKNLIRKYAGKLIRHVSKGTSKDIRTMADAQSREAIEAVRRLYSRYNINFNFSCN